MATCLKCPQNTFSLSGDITCTQCPPTYYAPASSAACFPSADVGGKMRIDLSYDTFREEDFIRPIALILYSEPSDINLLAYRSGSVINYFTISDPSEDELTLSGDTYNGIRQLSGNEKMLLLYQWFLTNDARIQALPFNIIDFSVYSVESNGNDGNVVTLFAVSNNNEAYLPYNHGQNNYNNGRNGGNSGSGEVKETTFEFSLTVAHANNVVAPSFFLLLISVFLSFFLF